VQQDMHAALHGAGNDQQRSEIIKKIRAAIAPPDKPSLPPVNIQRRKPGRRGWDEA